MKAARIRQLSLLFMDFNRQTVRVVEEGHFLSGEEQTPCIEMIQGVRVGRNEPHEGADKSLDLFRPLSG